MVRDVEVMNNYLPWASSTVRGSPGRAKSHDYEPDMPEVKEAGAATTFAVEFLW